MHGHSGMEDRAADDTCATAFPNPDQESSKASPTSCLTWAYSWISRDHGTPDAPASGGRIPSLGKGTYCRVQGACYSCGYPGPILINIRHNNCCPKPQHRTTQICYLTVL